MSALTALFSVTAVPTALTCLDGTTVSAEMATMTMGCLHQVENRVKVSKEDTEAKIPLSWFNTKQDGTSRHRLNPQTTSISAICQQ